MKIATYIIRFLLAALFLWAGYEKFFLPYNAEAFRAGCPDCNVDFFNLYDLLQHSGYLYFVGFFQFLCGALLVFKRTYVLGSIMLVPLILCLWGIHIFISDNSFYQIFDGAMFLLNAALIIPRLKVIWPVLTQNRGTWI
nr:DoxX family membrane protein [uncultured Allomuricauda sp.]